MPAQHIDQLIVTPTRPTTRSPIKVAQRDSPAGAVTATVSTSPQTPTAACAGDRHARRARLGTGEHAVHDHAAARPAVVPSDPFLYNLKVTLSDGGRTTRSAPTSGCGRSA